MPRIATLLPSWPLLTLLTLSTGACSEPNNSTTGPDTAADMAVSTDLAGSNDLRAAPDLAQAADLLPRCELPYELRLIKTVSTGSFTSAPSPGDPMVRTAEIDATAGGFANAANNPFIYLDLVNNKKVDISDVQAQTSRDWDIALKRATIKINSGDSGPGGVTATFVDMKNLDEVTAAPADPKLYEADSYFDAMCMVELDRIGGLGTAMSDWYDYVDSKVIPLKRVYVLNRHDGKGHIKLQITQYYKGMAGANYGISWGLLP